MWFGKNKKRIKLSRRLKWSIGKSQHTNAYFWLVGVACLTCALALIIHTNSPVAQSEPTVLGAATQASSETAGGLLQFTDYEVKRGDTLFSISTKFNIPTETLAQLNDINPPFTLKAGETLKVPVQ